MNIQDNPMSKLVLSEVTQLLDEMILELELRGCENHDEIIKKAFNTQDKVKTLIEN